MLPPAFRIVLAAILLLHGAGHALGLLPLIGKRLSPSHSADSLVLGPILGDSRARLAGALLWTVVIALFTAAALGIAGVALAAHWRLAGAVGSIISLAGLALYWNAFPFLFPNKAGLIIVDLAFLSWVYSASGV